MNKKLHVKPEVSQIKKKLLKPTLGRFIVDFISEFPSLSNQEESCLQSDSRF